MKSNVLGVLAGIATGALLGVLFAPDKGSNTRKKIKDKSIEAKDTLKDEFDNFLDTVSSKYDALVKDGKKIVKEGKHKLEKELEKEKEQVKNTVNSKI